MDGTTKGFKKRPLILMDFFAIEIAEKRKSIT